MEIGSVRITQLNEGGNSISDNMTYGLNIIELDREAVEFFCSVRTTG